MSRYKITEYRGIEINYDEQDDKFESVLGDQRRESGALAKLKQVIDKWLKQSANVEPIDVFFAKRGNELFRIEGREINHITDHPVLWFVKMKCPTGRTFVEPVEPGFAAANPDADICQGWLCGLKPDAYRNLAIEG